MSKDIKDLTAEQSAELIEKLKKLKNLMLMHLIDSEISTLDTKSAFEENTETKLESPDIIKEIEASAKSKTEVDKTLLLLHLSVPTNEYKEESNILDIGENLWYLTEKGSEKDWSGDNPLVSCWVPKESVVAEKSQIAKNEGSWGELGENPAIHEMKVFVKAGKYAIDKVIKQRVS
jgi:hypothetical protein